MKVHQIEVGNMQNFTYILEDEETGEAVTEEIRRFELINAINKIRK